MHCARDPGGGMFVRLARLSIRMLMDVRVIHVFLVFRRREFEYLRGFNADIVQVRSSSTPELAA
jgi:hypothetical protein